MRTREAVNKRVGTVPQSVVPSRTDLDQPVDRRPLLRGAGITGVSGSLLMLAAFVVVGTLGLPNPSSAESLQRFPDIQQARVVENLLYLAAVVFWAVQHDLLHRLLSSTGPVLTSAARTVGHLAVAALAASALLHLSTAPMSQAYQQDGEADRDGVVQAWTAAQAVMDALLITGALLLPVTVVLFGVASRRLLGPVLGWSAVALGAAGVVGATLAAANGPSVLVAVSVLGALVFHLAVGVRCIRLSRG